jgi:hypothetical protein
MHAIRCEVVGLLRNINPDGKLTQKTLSTWDTGFTRMVRGISLSLREIFDDKQLPMSLDHPDADRVHVGIQEVRLVCGRFHELGMRSRGIARLHNILREPAEVCARFGGASRQSGFARQAMRHRVLVGHFLRVSASRDGERLIPFQSRKAGRPPLAVCGFEQVFLGTSRLSLRPGRP